MKRLWSAAPGAVIACFWMQPTPSHAGPDACTTSSDGTQVTCKGNQSSGISAGTDFQTSVTDVIVENLTAPIAPASDTAAIEFSLDTGDTADDRSLDIDARQKITTQGKDASGIALTSISATGANGDDTDSGNGDGGAAGRNLTLNLIADSLETRTLTTGDTESFGVLVSSQAGAGGSNETNSDDDTGAGGNGGNLDVNVLGEITTNVPDSPAVLVQSLGGAAGTTAGGSGSGNGNNGGSAGDISLNTSSDGPLTVKTLAKSSAGFEVRSIAADGSDGDDPAGSSEVTNAGAGGFAGTITIGASPGNVGVATTAITTNGDDSPGIIAISQGGNAGRPSGVGNGNLGGPGGNITLYELGSGSITTRGEKSGGIVLQSIGGNSTPTENESPAMPGGVGGDITVGGNTDFGIASISTSGGASVGLSMMSSGGNGSLGFIDAGGDGGDAGRLTLNVGSSRTPVFTVTT